MSKDRVYTIKDIAEYAGVSRSTVSRIINNVQTRVAISEATRAKIHEAIRLFDYTPNASAHRLSVSRSFVIGLQLPECAAGNYAFSDYNLIGAMRGIEKALQSTNYSLQLLFGTGRKKYDSERLFKSRSIDGLLIWGMREDETFPAALRSYPVIMLNSLPRDWETCPTIVHDDYSGSRALVQSLLRDGAKSFLYVMGLEQVSICRERYQGFRDALAEAGVSFVPSKQIICGNFSYGSVADQAKSLFRNKRKMKFDAIVCSNDMMATAFYDAALAAGLTPQKDFLLAGADGVEDCARCNLRTYRCDRCRMGEMAIHEILRMIEKKDLSVFHTRIPVLDEGKDCSD